MENYKIYVNKFASQEEVQAALDNGTLNKPYVALIETASGNTIDFNTDEPTDYSKVPFTVEMLTNGKLKFWNYGSFERSFYYSKNGGEWTLETLNTSHRYLTLDCSQGDIVRFTVPSNQNLNESSSNYLQFVNEKNVSYKVYGNIMSLCYVDYVNATTIPNNSCFRKLFSGNNSLVDVEKLVLPATTLKNDCYEEMFRGCSNIPKAPVLGFTSISNNYVALSMFDGCSKLNYVKCMATSITGAEATALWLNNVSATGTFVKDANMSSWTSGASGIPDGWTVVDA